MPFIKIKKVWKKEFSQTELEVIWSFFKSLAPATIDWETTQYVDVLRRQNFVYPETDVWDDTEGVKPKQISNIINTIGLEAFKLLLETMSKTGGKYRTHPYQEEEGFIIWKLVFKEKILPLLEKSNPTVEIGKFIMGELSSQNQGPQNLRFYNYSDEVYEAFANQELHVEDFNAVLTKKPYPQNKKLTKSELSMKDFWDNRAKIWKDELNMVPQVQEMLLIEPKYWNKDVFLESLQYHFNMKQLGKLTKEQQTSFINLYKIFGPHIHNLNPIIKEKKYLLNNQVPANPNELYTKMDKPNQAFIKIVEESKKGIQIDISLLDLEQYMTSLMYFDDANNDISKKDRIKLKDLESLKEAASLAMSIIKSGKEKTLKHMNYQNMATLKKYNVNENQKKWALDLFERTCDLKTEVPLFNQTMGNYTVEMIDKDDIRGLVAGNATQCCQTLNGPKRNYSYGGNNCVYYGAEEKSSTFFLVSKNNRIIAQSWVWMHKGQLTFDNIEVLGQEIRDSIADAYQLYADYVYSLPKSKIKRVTVGTGHSDLKLSDYFSIAKDFEVIDEAYDARSTQFDIKKSK